MAKDLKNIKTGYSSLITGISELFEQARRMSARSVNAIITATYWETGRRIVDFEQHGLDRAAYGTNLLEKLSADLTKRFGRGFSRQNLQQMRIFYTTFPPDTICQTLSGKLEKAEKSQTSSGELSLPVPHATSGKIQTPSEKFNVSILSACFPLPWSSYVRLLAVKDDRARNFYETEALRGGWSVRQLDRQIESLFYERTALSKNRAAMLGKGAASKPGDALTPEEEIKDHFVLEFMGLKDEYSEGDLEDALVLHLEHFLLELGTDFAFVGRQKKLRIDDEWYKVDLIFFHRKLRCLLIIDLKIGRFTHADAGQMHTYLNYAKENWTNPGENPPVGLILCAQKGDSLARYALEGLPNKVMAAEYKTVLPDAKKLEDELNKTRRMLELRKRGRITVQ
jgi:predicted nuclease of restriction endonuclease-like (RecB) superfamily